MFILETIHTQGIAQLSYLLGDTELGVAAVIDPRTDVEVYLRTARRHGLAITHVFETHIHADFVSGSRSLADLTGTAKIWLSGEKSDYGFDGESLRNGDAFDFGSFLLKARHTPGHTPEHMALELSEAEETDRVRAVFSGDSLFAGSAGRPDLLGSGETDALAKQLYETLCDYYLKLEDHVLLYPGHGAGSACGADISDRLSSTIGYERRTNRFLRCHDFEEFHNLVIGQAPPVPFHYSHLKKVNARDPGILPRLPTVPALPPRMFRAAMREPRVSLVDTRKMLAFGGGHIAGAINIGDLPDLSVWAGQMIDPDQRLLLVVEDETKLDRIVRLIARTGHFGFAGYLAGGMKAWETAGLPLETIPQITVLDLHERLSSRSKLKVLDVRSPEEWEKGHIPMAEHFFVAQMRSRIDGLDRARPYAVYCASGYRASIAASLMKARGFEDVSNVPGSWDAWCNAKLPVEKPVEAAAV